MIILGVVLGNVRKLGKLNEPIASICVCVAWGRGVVEGGLELS